MTTPLGKDVLLLREATVNERLSMLFEIELDLLSEDDRIPAASLLGQPATVRLEIHDQNQRFFNGYVSRFSHVGFEGRLAVYRATLVPWLWLLTRVSDCRIFQGMSVPDIVAQVFRDAGFSDFETRLSGAYRVWEYCVQYRETHFNFVTRLMEHEGIYWYFTHEDGRHNLVMADDYGSHRAVPGYAEIPYHAADPTGARHQDFIFNWSRSSVIRSGAFAHDAFDFRKPEAELRSSAVLTRPHAHAAYEIFDYPGEYEAMGEGERYASIRMEELQADHEIVRGDSSARGLAAGHLFTLTDCPRADQNREYLLISVSHRMRSDEFQTTESLGGSAFYQCGFSAMDAREPFRPARVTPRPIVRGPQTAIVVGPAGEEIWTDEYGRVKVQFHWDRYGEMDDNSSCWIRVSQLWAGQQWGAMHLPRIGQEVIVDFLEGDPDQPIITGRVYNGDLMPPYALPANQTQSGVKSRSTRDGGPENFNEIRFEDKKGQEEVYVHAERDLNTLVEVNESRDIGDSRTTLIQNDETLRIKAGDRSETLEQGSDTLRVSLGDITIEAPAGTYSVSAMDVAITGTTSVKIVCGGSSIEMTPASITISSPTIEISASALATVKGGMVKINC
ncbi:type VI secretion system tip protein VgrG [Thiocystis violacea]|uniref:type VI secretion system Vgr family protein n=1 Tax=Thiocystis violacea TaxID=13725 RepID=UPI0030B8F7CF